MNNGNLTPFVANSERTVEIATMGGIASGEARRERKRLKEAIETALQLPYYDVFTGQTTTNLEAVVAALIEQARKGDVSAFRAIRDTIDGLPTQRIEQTEISPETYERVAKALAGDDE